MIIHDDSILLKYSLHIYYIIVNFVFDAFFHRRQHTTVFNVNACEEVWTIHDLTAHFVGI